MFAGLDDPDGGSVSISGERISHIPELAKTRLRARYIGMMFQERNLIEHLTVGRNVVLAMRLAGIRKPRPAQFLERLGIADKADSFPSELSGGEAARAALAVAVAKNPLVLLADEPTGEVDLEAESQVIDILRDLRHSGTSTVIVTHSERVASSADRVVRLLDGRMVS